VEPKVVKVIGKGAEGGVLEGGPGVKKDPLEGREEGLKGV